MKKLKYAQKHKYGSVALILTALIICAVVLLNMIVSALAARFEFLYWDMNQNTVYSISEDCKSYIEEFIIPEFDEINSSQDAKEKITVIFCDSQENIKADESKKYIYSSFEELADIYPTLIEIKHLDIYQNPSEARKYGASSTGDVICSFFGRHETMKLADFYIADENDSSKLVAYNGEKIIASCLMRVTQNETPKCYFIANHGEEFAKVDLIRSIVEAGYTVGFLDLIKDDIPNDCDLLVSFDPKGDMSANDGASSVNEIEKLNRYMANGGKYMVFVSADTFALGEYKNFEGFLSEWGVSFMHTKGTESEECYLLQDSSNSLSVDGYTFLSQNANTGYGADILPDAKYLCAFANSTCIGFDDNFSSDGKGNLVSQDGKIISPVLVSSNSAIAWAGGRAVARAQEDPFALMTMTTQVCENGRTSYLLAVASTEFASSSNLNSGVLGNSRAIGEILKYMGKENTPASLIHKSFSGIEIQSLTTSVANTVTIAMTIIPAIIITGLGVFVLIRRRNR